MIASRSVGVITILISILAAATIAEERAAALREDPKLTALFAEYNVQGTIVVFNPDTHTLVGHNIPRGRERFIPASTFKIPNSLIALENGAVVDVDQVVPYGGKPQLFRQWERNMSMRDAIKVSAVPVYQELARRVGLEKMQHSVKELNYRTDA